MCGFFQVIARNGSVNESRFDDALDSIRHRGPDDSGKALTEWQADTQEKTFVAASGHRRLAILDLNPRSKQPFGSDEETLLFNGEIYNYTDIKPELESEGAQFHTTGDTEVLFEALKHRSTGILPNFNGMWAFSYLDKSKNRLTASRDRYGKKPLFYYQDESTICLSSTIRAIHIYLARKPALTQHALQSFLTYGTMYPPSGQQTHFEAIQQVEPGSVYEFDLQTWTVSKHPYFDPSQPKETDLDDPGQLAEYLKIAVSSRLVSDRPVALLLSGGVDSSLLLSILCAMNLQDQVHVYMGETGRSDDYKYAKKCADQLGVTAKTIVLDYGNRSFERFLSVCKHHEKAFLFNGNALAMPEMYEAISNDGIPVVLDGTGGDEFFGGYWNRQFPYAVREELSKGDSTWVNVISTENGKSNNIHKHIRNSRRSEKLTNWWGEMQPRLSTARHRYLNTPFSELLKCSPTDPLTKVDHNFTQALVRDISAGGRLGEWVWHNDRNAMMSSVENRSPLLDFRLHSYLFTGHKKKFVGQFNKHELRSVFDAFNQLPTQWRWQKQGFRWNGKSFIRQNETNIRDLIRECTWLEDSIDLKKFSDRSRKFPSMLRTTLAKRMLTIAGLQATM
jgi:asparagine synthase (glutamine-hydrolysing)